MGGQQIFIFILNYFGPGATRNLASDSHFRANVPDKHAKDAKDAKEPRLDRNTWPQMAQISRITEGKES